MMRNLDLDTIIGHFEAALSPLSDSEIKVHEATGAFRYIPYRINAFLEQLDTAVTARRVLGCSKPKFLDVGCGIGTKVLLAQHFGCDAYGLEINPKYVEVARKVLAGGGGFEAWSETMRRRRSVAKHIIEADALTFDYSPYDIIYFYCPQRHVEDGKGGRKTLERRLEQRILDTATPGTVVMANLAAHPAFGGTEGVWKKGCETIRLADRNIYLIEPKKRRK